MEATGGSVEADAVEDAIGGGELAKRTRVEHIRDEGLDSMRGDLCGSSARPHGTANALTARRSNLPRRSPR